MGKKNLKPLLCREGLQGHDSVLRNELRSKVLRHKESCAVRMCSRNEGEREIAD